MRQTVLAVLVCLIVIVIVFQNTLAVSFNIANNTFKIPMAAIIVSSFTIGVVTGIMLLSKKRTADKSQIMELKRKIVFLETPDSFNKQQ